MGIELRTGFIGLATNTAELQAPPGALAQANNVVIRRPGACEVRPGIQPYTQIDYPADYVAMRLIPYGGTQLVPVDDGSGDLAEWWDASANVQVLYEDPFGVSSEVPALFAYDKIPSAQTRANLYVGTRIGTLKWNQGEPLIQCGIPPWTEFVVTGYTPSSGTPFLPDGSQVQYAAVLVRTDPNGLEISSQPTGPWTYLNTSGGAEGVSVQVFLNALSASVDFVELYRTRTYPSTVTPDTEMQLVGRLPADTAVTFQDNLLDNQRGKTLYTSPSREGAEGANYRPPAAGALAVYKGTLFTGNTVGPRRLTVSFTYETADLAGQPGGIGVRTYTGDITNGSAVVTNMSGTVGLEPGMRIFVGGFGGGTFVVAVNPGASTVTMSSPAVSTTVGASIEFYDAISVDGGTTWTALTATVPDQGSERFSNDAFAIRLYPSVNPSKTITWAIETIRIGVGAVLQVQATHGDEYDAPLPEYGETPAEGEQDILPNGLAWSKPDEPEHFPLVNTARVGDQAHQILALCATRDALFIFKEDGIWRLTGIPGQFRIDPFDLTTRCILPCSVQPLKNRIYFLANTGICALTDAGVQVVSVQIADLLRPLIWQIMQDKEDFGIYTINNMTYCAAASDRDGEYILGIKSMLEEEPIGLQRAALVYNEITGAWVSWTFGPLTGDTQVTCNALCFAWDPNLDRMLIGCPEGVVKAFAQPQATDDYVSGARYACDGTEDLIVDFCSESGEILLQQSASVEVGDAVLSGDGVFYRVTDVASDTEFTVAGVTAEGEIASGALYRPIHCTVRPRGFYAPNPVQKLWTHTQAQLSSFTGAVYARFGALASVVAGSTTLEETPVDLALVAGATQYRLGAALRTLLPTAAARGYRLTAEFYWSQCIDAACLEAIAVEYREGTTNRDNLAVRT